MPGSVCRPFTSWPPGGLFSTVSPLNGYSSVHVCLTREVGPLGPDGCPRPTEGEVSPGKRVGTRERRPHPTAPHQREMTDAGANHLAL